LIVPCSISGWLTVSQRIHDLSDPGLVVSTQQRCPIGGDDVIADLAAKQRIFIALITTPDSVDKTKSPPA
jgi:hypothetical protein